jgi:GNAT superfamily N-acetyltransferase
MMGGNFRINRVKSDNRDFLGLVAFLDSELNSRYGALQAQYDRYNNVDTIDTVVIGYMDNIPAGCGCFKVINDDIIEIKRMFVKPEFRGTGIAGMILSELEAWAVEKGLSVSILETGIKQPEAIRFYKRLGYKSIENFGQYAGNENSICFSKELKIDL